LNSKFGSNDVRAGDFGRW